MTRNHLAALCAALIMAPGAAGQVPLDADPGRSERTRADLERLLEYYDEVMRSPVYSSGVKDQVRTNAEQVRARLRDGDFRVGDRIVMYVEGEATLPDTVTVEGGPAITLPLFGDISLQGVLRSEIQAHLTQALSQFIRDPVVRAKGLMRVSIQGAVVRPGFYVLPADVPLSDVLMVAGGIAPNANLDGLRIDRGTNRVIDGTELQDAMREGLTLDQLNLQAGDQVMLPERGGGFFGNIGIIAGIVGSLSLLIFQLTN